MPRQRPEDERQNERRPSEPAQRQAGRGGVRAARAASRPAQTGGQAGGMNPAALAAVGMLAQRMGARPGGQAREALMRPPDGGQTGRQTAPGRSLTVDEALRESGAQAIGKAEIAEAEATLQRYRSGKAALEKRIIENDEWFRMRYWKDHNNRMMQDKPKPASGWLFNSIANKHADAMDNYPEPNVLPRAADDEGTAKELSSILPVVLEQTDYEKVWSDSWWRKLKQGTGVKGVFWDPTARGGVGDIAIRCMDILRLYWEPGCMDIQASPNFFSLSIESSEALENLWPQLKEHTGSSISVAQYIHDDSTGTAEKSVVVDWYYKKRNRAGKQVLHYCKFCNGIVLYASENDPQLAERGFYDHGKYPFVFDVLFQEEDSPAGFGYIDVMKDCQISIDKMNQAMDENVLLASKQRYVLSDAAGVNEEELADFSRDIVHVTGRLSSDSFHQMQTAGLQASSITYRNSRVDELKEISGNRDISQGGASGGVTAASAIAALQEAGSKLSRDMIKSAYRAFAQECYLVIDLMRQFYDEQRVFRITGASGQNQFVQFSGQMLRAPAAQQIGGVVLGGREPVFDVTISAAKKSTFSKLSQNETAKECYQLGFFNPANADAALAALEMMDFEGIEKVRERVQQNGTLLQQLQAAQQQIMQMAMTIEQLTAGAAGVAGAAAGAANASQQKATGGRPGSADSKTATNGLGQAVGSNAAPLATAAATRAMNVNNPNQDLTRG